VLAVQTPFDLGHEVFRKPQVIEGLLEGRSGMLRLAAVARETRMRFQATTLAGFGVVFGVSFREGHGELLCTVWIVGSRCEDNHIPSA
jgi:hypothetical protein